MRKDCQVKGVAEKKLILDGYVEENLNGVSYDLTMDVTYDESVEEFQNATRSCGKWTSLSTGVSFQDEVQYKGLGNYQEEYGKQTKRRLEQTEEDIENTSQKIYANILTLMGVLVALAVAVIAVGIKMV